MLKTTARKPTDIAQLKLRLREDLRRKLEREAAKKGHSLNTEMVERLEASFAVESQARDQNQMLTAIGGTVKSVIENMGFVKFKEWLERSDERSERRNEQLREQIEQRRHLVSELRSLISEVQRLENEWKGEGSDQLREQLSERFRELIHELRLPKEEKEEN